MLTQEKIEFEQHQLGVGTLEIWSANVKISDGLGKIYRKPWSYNPERWPFPLSFPELVKIVGCGRSWLDFSDSTNGEPTMIQNPNQPLGCPQDAPFWPLISCLPIIGPSFIPRLAGKWQQTPLFWRLLPVAIQEFDMEPQNWSCAFVGMLLCNHKFLLHLLEFSFHPSFNGGSSLTSKNVDSTEWVKENQINLAIQWKTTGKSMWKITNCGRDWLTQPTSLALFRRYPLVFLSQVRWPRPLISLFSVAQIPISSGSIRLNLPISAAEKIPSVHFCQK